VALPAADFIVSIGNTISINQTGTLQCCPSLFWQGNKSHPELLWAPSSIAGHTTEEEGKRGIIYGRKEGRDSRSNEKYAGINK
jgi:hypothetical protein